MNDPRGPIHQRNVTRDVEDVRFWMPAPNIDGLPARWVPPGARLQRGDLSVGRVMLPDSKRESIDYRAITEIEASAVGLIVDDLDLALFARRGPDMALVTTDEEALAILAASRPLIERDEQKAA